MSLKMKALAVLLGVAMAVSPTVGGECRYLQKSR